MSKSSTGDVSVPPPSARLPFGQMTKTVTSAPCAMGVQALFTRW
jgi:hypothetical protein